MLILLIIWLFSLIGLIRYEESVKQFRFDQLDKKETLLVAFLL